LAEETEVPGENHRPGGYFFFLCKVQIINIKINYKTVDPDTINRINTKKFK
jgi:hypothetical protein